MLAFSTQWHVLKLSMFEVLSAVTGINVMCLQRDYSNELHGGLERNLISCTHQNKTFSDSLKSSLPHCTRSSNFLWEDWKRPGNPKLTYIPSKLPTNLSWKGHLCWQTWTWVSPTCVSVPPCKNPQREPVVTELAVEKILLDSSK